MDETHTPAPVEIIRLPGVPANAHADDWYFPINIDQVRDLKESLFTRLEMLNLSKKAEDAAKVVFQEFIWQWFAHVQENSTTSYKGCIAPVVCDEHKDSKFYPSNRWGYKSEEEYNEALPKVMENPFVGGDDGKAED